MRRVRASAWGAVALLGASCGGGSSPSAPVPLPAALPVAAATPAPTTAPIPVPTPTPCPFGLCEEPVTNSGQAARIAIRLYLVADADGAVQWGFDPKSPIPLGYKVTIDATAKDKNDKETHGVGDVVFELSNPQLVRVGGNHEFQRKLTVLRPGILEVTASLDTVRSTPLTLRLGN